MVLQVHSEVSLLCEALHTQRTLVRTLGAIVPYLQNAKQNKIDTDVVADMNCVIELESNVAHAQLLALNAGGKEGTQMFQCHV